MINQYCFVEYFEVSFWLLTKLEEFSQFVTKAVNIKLKIIEVHVDTKDYIFHQSYNLIILKLINFSNKFHYYHPKWMYSL